MKKKIMLVDDNLDLLKVFKKRLESITGEYEVIGVKSGKECFDLLKEGQIPDLILLDIMMPEINGWDVLAKLRRDSAWEKIPVIFLTAKTDDTSKGLGTLTSEGYITKPFEMTEIIETIEKFFERR